VSAAGFEPATHALKGLPARRISHLTERDELRRSATEAAPSKAFREWRNIPSHLVRFGGGHKTGHSLCGMNVSLPLFRDVPTKFREGGVVHSAPALVCGGTGAIFAGESILSYTISTISARTKRRIEIRTSGRTTVSTDNIAPFRVPTFSKTILLDRRQPTT
jgi:hypothetical protein